MRATDVRAGSSFLESVRWRGAIADPGQAQEVVAIVLGVLASHLPAADAADVLAALPREVGAGLTMRERSARSTPAEVYERVAAAQGVTRGAALERVRAACESLGDALGVERRLLFARRLPPEWSALLAAAPRARAADTPRGTPPGHGHTLATGRPGSRHPLSESRPPGPQEDSVAADNPHGDTKLSSTTGPVGVEPLATSQPRAGASLATAKDERRED